MSDLTILGLGSMGATIASVLLKAGFSVSVWNRSIDKARPLEAIGATAAASVERAIGESPCTIICIDGYQNATSLLDRPQVLEQLSGRTVISMVQSWCTRRLSGPKKHRYSWVVRKRSSSGAVIF